MSLCFNRLPSPLALFLLLIISTVPALGARRALDKVVVIVNDEIILNSDISDFKKKLSSKSFQELLGVDPAILNSRQAILQLLVEEKIINQQVKKLDLGATPEEIDGQIRSILTRNNITKAQLQERLKQLNTSLTEYREGIKRQIERRNLIDREIKPTLKISDEQLRHYYIRKEGKGSQIQYSIAHILISSGPNAKKRADSVYKELSDGKIDFKAAAKQYSDDSSTAEQGGALGNLSLNSLAKEFQAVVPNTKVGDITKPIKTGAGYHIVKVLETKQDPFKSLNEAKKEEIRNTVFSEELERRMVLWLERKKKEAHIKVVSQ
ncbi:MAG: peptidylprolyl isomerase [Bdellovibrionaceae bacterium]|nr:peptidylprolyl isomerase [Bdellovibrionales bacterium]MCB9253369.1 peptidylprolyl isomerase [Pseudobdellovibrionaceae bacterium]